MSVHLNDYGNINNKKPKKILKEVFFCKEVKEPDLSN